MMAVKQIIMEKHQLAGLEVYLYAGCGSGRIYIKNDQTIADVCAMGVGTIHVFARSRTKRRRVAAAASSTNKAVRTHTCGICKSVTCDGLSCDSLSRDPAFMSCPEVCSV